MPSIYDQDYTTAVSIKHNLQLFISRVLSMSIPVPSVQVLCNLANKKPSSGAEGYTPCRAVSNGEIAVFVCGLF